MQWIYGAALVYCRWERITCPLATFKPGQFMQQSCHPDQLTTHAPYAAVLVNDIKVMDGR